MRSAPQDVNREVQRGGERDREPAAVSRPRRRLRVSGMRRLMTMMREALCRGNRKLNGGREVNFTNAKLSVC